jgi:hypothetical protein
MDNLIKDIKKPSSGFRFLRKYVLNKYVITITVFLVWMTFSTVHLLVINELNGEIKKYEEQLDYYKKEYQKMIIFIKANVQQI